MPIRTWIRKLRIIDIDSINGKDNIGSNTTVSTVSNTHKMRELFPNVFQGEVGEIADVTHTKIERRFEINLC